MRHLLLLVLLPALWAKPATAADTLGLQRAIGLARLNSPEAQAAHLEYLRAEWRLRTWEASRLPAITLEGTVPNYNRSLERLTLPDGRDSFVARQLSTSGLDLNISQQAGPLGGRFFINSSMQRIDNFTNRNTSYLAAPVNIGYDQPLFTYNEIRWNARIEPQRYWVARKAYQQAMEDIALQAVNQFFNVLTAQVDLQIANTNLTNNDTLYRLSQMRYEMGRIGENELLQVELNRLNAEMAMQEAAQQLQSAMFNLKTTLGMPLETELDLVVPQVLRHREVPIQDAVHHAELEGLAMAQARLRQMESDRGMAEAIGNTGFRASLFAQFGLNNSTQDVTNVYRDLQDRQQFRVGFRMPLVDWGRNRGIIAVARAEYAYNTSLIEVDRARARQAVYEASTRYNMMVRQVEIGYKADTVGQRRYFIAMQRFLIGRIALQDLNVAQIERDAAQRAALDALRRYWQAYYNLRRLALYDFVLDMPLGLPERQE